MEKNLDKALSSILGVEITPEQPASSVISKIKGEGLSTLGATALDHYNNAKEYLRHGDWTGYGRELENLEKILKEMSGMKKEKK
jgi:acyl carrier protein phosphodiesterase